MHVGGGGGSGWLASRDLCLRAFTKMRACTQRARACVCMYVCCCCAQVVPYNQRIALLLYKLQESVKALGKQEHALALGYAAATMHDVTALFK